MKKIPFVPAIYEHKAALINRTPSQVCRERDLMVEAVVKEYETYGADQVVVGIDVYNVEAEALGSRVTYFEDNGCPAIKEPLIRDFDSISNLKTINPGKHGRMTLFTEAAGKIKDKIGDKTEVLGAVSAPFTMASTIMDFEFLLMEMVSSPDDVKKLLEFTLQVCLDYSKAFMDQGVGVVFFDSRSAPPFMSSGMFRDFLLPCYSRLFHELKEQGLSEVPLVIGGDTEIIMEDIVETGVTLALADFPVHRMRFKEFVEKHAGIRYRVNVDPMLFQEQKKEELLSEVKEVIDIFGNDTGFILGTGILPYDTDPEIVLAVKDLLTVQETA
jgi:uroporphyrinogen decarboxylase